MGGRDSTKKLEVIEKEHARGSDVQSVEAGAVGADLAAAVMAHPPSLWSKGMLKLWGLFLIGYCISTMNGFDGSLMGSINAMPEYHKTFGIDGTGSNTGIIFIIYNLGQVAAFPLCGLLADRWGRRWAIFLGCLTVVIGTAVQTPASTKGQFIAGRFILGFGAAIAQSNGPVYIVELAHPAFRGMQAGMYNNFWWIGNILASWTTYGCNKNVASSWAWRIPTLVQCFLPGLVALCILFMPESPRWLITKDRQEEAVQIFAKYHADNDVTAPIVTLQINEIVGQLKEDESKNNWWDFKELFDTRAARYRSAMVICMAFFGQWSGNSVVSYFMPGMLKNAGITDSSKQLLINAINPIFSMLAAIYGATLLDKLGRRRMLLGGLAGALVSYVCITAFSARSGDNPDLVYGLIVFIYLFGIFFAWGWTPLQVLYPVECLTNRTRAKGAGMKFLFINIASMTNLYGIAVGIAKIKWKLYLVFVVWITIEMLVVFFFFVETAGKTLEEMSEVFEAKNPVKKSLEKVSFNVNTNVNKREGEEA